MKSIMVFIVSDVPDEIGKLLVRAVTSVFENAICEVRFHPFVDDNLSIDYLLGLAKQENGIIVYRFNAPDLAVHIESEAARKGVPIYNVEHSLVEKMRMLTGEEPIQRNATGQELDARYLNKTEAIEFAVKYDDGKRTTGLDKADIILLGVSRASKTPLSVYLANNDYKVANIPLIPEVEPPDELFKISRKKIFGLVLDPKNLVKIRAERIKAMGLKGDSNYGSYERVLLELEKSRQLFDRLGCTVIDVTSKAIEEIAAIILADINWR